MSEQGLLKPTKATTETSKSDSMGNEMSNGVHGSNDVHSRNSNSKSNSMGRTSDCLPLCRFGADCRYLLSGTSESEHINRYRHHEVNCSDDNGCPNFHNESHMINLKHSFKKPCPFTPYNCSLFIQYTQAAAKDSPFNVRQHYSEYSHVCQYGRQCKLKDENHFQISIHVARKMCPDLEKCSKLTDESHLESFSHPNIPDIRYLCRDPGYNCPARFNNAHLRKYRHKRDSNILSIALLNDLNSSINFFQNQQNMIKTVNSYVEASKWENAKIPEDVLDWVRALQPVHRCGPEIFASILVHGHVMSRDYMNELNKPKSISNAVIHHNRIRSIFLRHHTSAVKTHVNGLIALLVKDELLKSGSTAVPSLDPDHGNQINITQRRLVPPLDENELRTIRDWTAKIVAASIHLNTHLTGIGYDVDKKLDTYKHVFSILGPHHGTYYGDIVITFKQEIMFHPDANFSIQAGTSFSSGRVYTFRPWRKNPTNENERIKDFHEAKLHCSYPDYEYAAAVELMATTGKKKSTMNVSLEEIIKSWTEVDSHFVFEGHLPSLIPLDYIDKVYMPTKLYQSLSEEAQKLAREIFNDSMILADYDIDLTQKPSFPPDSSRQPYFAYIIDELNNKICERMKMPRISRGFIITIPGTAFEKHTVLPLTISQSYHLHCLNKDSPGNSMEETYIYWQAMDGDMMLTITDTKLRWDGNDASNLQCLICYVADKPSANEDSYHEEYSYLNIGSPYQHENNIHAKNLKAKSNRFYRGCKTGDYFTFCLKITYKTGEVSLTHAGPNGLYNHENIRYHFDMREIDLLKLEYIHVSAGAHDVPIRNLIIRHEQVKELHPTYDKDFKFSTAPLSRTTPPIKPKLIPCENSVYCLLQYGEGDEEKSHIKQFSHPCRFNELCAKRSSEPHLVHRILNNPTCVDDEICSKLTDPVHRAQYRHKGRPDYLIPCRFQDDCTRQDRDHRLKYFHGEEIPQIKKNNTSTSRPYSAVTKTKLIPCRHGDKCWSKNDSDHTAKYSHPSS